VGRNIRDVLSVVDETTQSPLELPIAATVQLGRTEHVMGGMLVSKDGRRIPIEDSISPILSASHEARGAILVFRDVTEQRKAEHNLRESESRYRFLANAVPEFIFTTGAHGQRDYCNQRWYDYTGLTEEQSLQQGWLSVVHPDDVAQAITTWAHAVETATPYECEYRIRNRDAKYRWFLARGFPMRDPEGAITQWFGICTDIEDLKRGQEQLEQVRKMEAVGRLAGGIAHDFNNLLTVILGYGRMLADTAERAGRPSTEATNILYAASRAAELTKQLLTFSRRQVIRPSLVNLNQVVSDLDGMLRRLIAEDILVQTALGPNLPFVRIDRGQMEQVIVNLAVNARDAMPEGGHLVVETAAVNLDESYAGGHMTVEPGRYVMLAVSDTGQGMDDETQSHIFEPFFTTKEPGKGTGLGLATVYGIVRQTGGHIWVYSEPGRGATFKIYLPAVEKEADEEGANERPPYSARAGTETVLVLEDEEQVRQLVQSMLARQGYQVLAFGSAEDALRLCENHPEEIQLLITDVVMPGMSGRQVAQLARERRPNLKVLYMSGYTGDAIAHHGVLDCGVEFLQKPFSSETLLGKVREVLDAGNSGSSARG
jgi:PAS domain S-box-containing protein